MNINHFEDAAKEIRDHIKNCDGSDAYAVSHIYAIIYKHLRHLEFYEKKYEEHEKELEKAVGPDGVWKNASIAHNELTLTIGCVQVTLQTDGTYYLTDISG